MKKYGNKIHIIPSTAKYHINIIFSIRVGGGGYILRERRHSKQNSFRAPAPNKGEIKATLSKYYFRERQKGIPN